MADPLLNTLCTICHTNAPKYICPGCSAQTCSLPCTKKHKSWADCTGRRDPAAFMPASRLKTASGIDHDYNFLSAIERERGRNQRDLVEDRRLFTEREAREMGDDSRFRKQWLGDSVRFEPVRDGPRTFGEDVVGAAGGDGDGDGDGGGDDNSDGGDAAGGGGANVPAKASYLTRQVRQRLDGLGIQVVQMPVGMTRQRENTTSWNRKSRNINWCVEWMVYDGGDDDAEKEGCRKTTTITTTTTTPTHTRIRHKALESVPLYKALGNSMAWYRKGQNKGDQDEEGEEEEGEEPAYARKRRRVLIREVREDEGRRTAMQVEDGGGSGCSAGTWAAATPYPAQNPHTGAWGVDRGASVTSWLPDHEVAARRGHRFYLARPLAPAGAPRELIPVGPDETLASALQGRSVLEYPTVYVLPPPSKTSATDNSNNNTSAAAAESGLPEGFILGSTERRERPKRNNNKNAKRKANDTNDKKDKASQPPHKRQAAMSAGGGGGDGGPEGIPIRGPNNQRGRGGARGGRGNGRIQQQQQQVKGGKRQQRPAQDAEEGEIDSEGDEVPRRPARRPAPVVADPADTSSSDPDTSSDEEEGVGQGQGQGQREEARGFARNFSLGSAVHVDDDDGPPEEAAGRTKAPGGLGLVEYGSDSDGSDEDGEDEEEDEGVDLAAMKPEDPELVANAIKEIVGLLT